MVASWERAAYPCKRIGPWGVISRRAAPTDMGCRVAFRWSLVGSSNWDPRSLRLNFEFNVECYNQVLARRLHEVVDDKQHGAEEVTLDAVNARSFPVRMRDGLARLLTPFL